MRIPRLWSSLCVAAVLWPVAGCSDAAAKGEQPLQDVVLRLLDEQLATSQITRIELTYESGGVYSGKALWKGEHPLVLKVTAHPHVLIYTANIDPDAPREPGVTNDADVVSYSLDGEIPVPQ